MPNQNSALLSVRINPKTKKRLIALGEILSKNTSQIVQEALEEKLLKEQKELEQKRKKHLSLVGSISVDEADEWLEDIQIARWGKVRYDW